MRARLRPALIDTIEQHGAALPELMQRPIQTNEVGRSAALLVGFLDRRARDGTAAPGPGDRRQRGAQPALGPISLHGPGGRMGRPGLTGADRGCVHRRAAAARCAARRSSSGAAAIRARSTRPPRTRGSRCSRTPGRTSSGASRSCARRSSSPRRCRSTCERAGAVEWLDELLAAAQPGVATVVFHSVVLPYLGRAGHRGPVAHARGRRRPRPAGRAARVAEPRGRRADLAAVRLMTWPGGEARLLAHASFHGPPVRWVGSAATQYGGCCSYQSPSGRNARQNSCLACCSSSAPSMSGT